MFSSSHRFVNQQDFWCLLFFPAIKFIFSSEGHLTWLGMVFCPNHHWKCNPLTFDILTFQLTSHLQSAVVFFVAFSSLIIHGIGVPVSPDCTLKISLFYQLEWHLVFASLAGPYSAWKVWGLCKSCRARGFSYWLTKQEGWQVRLRGSVNVCSKSRNHKHISCSHWLKCRPVSWLWKSFCFWPARSGSQQKQGCCWHTCGSSTAGYLLAWV